MKTRRLSYLFLAIALGDCVIATTSVAQPYELDRVAGISQFAGSDAARELLRKNGFVVASPVFKQIFEPYIESPRTAEPSDDKPSGTTLPSFITVDSAWHTYHVLFEEGVKELEEAQSERLATFSSRLRADALRDSLPEIASFAAIGLALQDQAARASLNSAEKTIVEALLHGSGNVSAPIGFPLSPIQFRAQSFYTQSSDLSAYFAARQWFGCVVFRLENPHETDLALKLASLVTSDTNLFTLWKQLSDPLDALIAGPEDGTVLLYADAAKSGSPDEILKKLRATVPKPLINDQQLSREEYLKFDGTTRGFRLLPPRQLPCSVCFRKSTDPFIANRLNPSGIDFMVASPTLRSTAAIRAARSQFGKKTADALLKVDAGPMPDSLYGESMKLLSKLQQPLPASVAPAFRNDAWADLQLWTQLSAWAEQRHTWALHAKLTVNWMGLIEPPRGIVAPYPDFFAGLAQLSRNSAAALQKARVDAPFDLKSVAMDMLQQLSKYEAPSTGEETMSAHTEHFAAFFDQYYSTHRIDAERHTVAASDKLKSQLHTMAEKVSRSGQATPEETATLKDFYDSRIVIAGMLTSFAETCDRLADLATKCRDQRALSEEDAQWIERYGTTLAGYHFYQGNSYEVPVDNFPIVTRVYANPLASSLFYAGLARPQAIYVIVDNQLYRGAVMSYREFVRSDDQLLDDESWREVVREGHTPAAPGFTRSFYAERSFADWLKVLKMLDESDSSGRRDALWQLGSSATEKDLPDLVKTMESSADGNPELAGELAQMIGGMSCGQFQSRFIELLGSEVPTLSYAAAVILNLQATNFDSAPVIESFDSQSPRAQRLRLAILSAVPKQTDPTATVLMRALKNSNDGVRWQAAEAIATAHWPDNAPTNALVDSLKDSNLIVAANAVRALVRLNAASAGPAVLAELKLCLSHPPSDVELRSEQESVAFNYQSSMMAGGSFKEMFSLIDPDGTLMRMESRMSPRVSRRSNHVPVPDGNRPFRLRDPMPPVPGGGDFLGETQFDSFDIWIQSLGALQCRDAENDLLEWLSSDRKTAAFSALEKLGSPRLVEQMLATAKDTQANSEDREGALIDLCRLNATNQIHDIAGLLDDTTPIDGQRLPPGREWRICDRAADTIAGLLGWRQRLRVFSTVEEQKAFEAKVRKSVP